MNANNLPFLFLFGFGVFASAGSAAKDASSFDYTRSPLTDARAIVDVVKLGEVLVGCSAIRRGASPSIVVMAAAKDNEVNVTYPAALFGVTAKGPSAYVPIQTKDESTQMETWIDGAYATFTLQSDETDYVLANGISINGRAIDLAEFTELYQRTKACLKRATK
jgi:hypothetical protein